MERLSELGQTCMKLFDKVRTIQIVHGSTHVFFRDLWFEISCS